MKKLLLLTAIALIANGANASEVKPYVEGKISQNWLKADYKEEGFKEKFKDNVFGGSLEVGAKINQFRVGLEGYYNDKMEDKIVGILPVEGETKGFFLNGYLDIPVCENLKQIKPYIGAGIGYSWLKATLKETPFNYEGSIKDKDWGWNVGFGVGYAINANIDLTLGYRYEDLGRIKDYESKTDFTNHKVSLGIRYSF